MGKKAIRVKERILRITGTAVLPEKLEAGHAYTIGLSVRCKSVMQDDNEDGTFNLVHNLKMLGEFIVEKDWGRQVYAKVKGNFSQKWRWWIKKNGYDYDKFGAKILRHLEEVAEFIEKLE